MRLRRRKMSSTRSRANTPTRQLFRSEFLEFKVNLYLGAQKLKPADSQVDWADDG